MRYLSFTIIVLLYSLVVHGQTSPHGKAFKNDCSQCHTSQSWTVKVADIQFNHSKANFKLIGQHRNIHCRECHKSLTFKDERRNCIDCHTDMHNQTLGKNCERCHTPNTWLISDVTSLHQQTRFPLLGAHRTVGCRECHTSASVYQFETLGIDCVNCHRQDYLQTTTPNHVAGRYSTDCLDCHSENSTSWNTGLIDHDFFPLTGGHAIGCGLCHVSKKYEKISAECNACHSKQFIATQLPRHVEAGIPVKCETCHNISGWKPASFNHTTTGFELKGAHKLVVQCSQCHKGNVTSSQQACIGCHQSQFDVAPGHRANGYSTDCTKCHSLNNWLATSFDHSTTIFPLTGAHTTVLCSLCHANGYANTPTACQSCHLTAFNSSQVPRHVAAGIPKECVACHTTAAWKPSTFNHTATGFELKGAHRSVAQCADCHKGTLTTALQTCISCHQPQFDTALNHKTQSYPADCTLCHTQNNWIENIFSHSTTSFPLTGAHTSVLCAKCHTTGFKGTPTACYSCHAAKYNASVNPNHLAAKFPTNCEMCHTSTAWTPSTYNHDAQYFPINSGKHQGKWTRCSDCHNVPTNYATFTCILCHEHSSKASVDADHSGVKNYTYASTACYNCHPQGR